MVYNVGNYFNVQKIMLLYPDYPVEGTTAFKYASVNFKNFLGRNGRLSNVKTTIKKRENMIINY